MTQRDIDLYLPLAITSMNTPEIDGDNDFILIPVSDEKDCNAVWMINEEVKRILEKSNGWERVLMLYKKEKEKRSC